MDLRAFGSVYPYRANVPYASGFGYVPDPTGVSGITFSACRGLYIEAKASGNKGYLALQLADAPNQILRADHLLGDTIYPISCIAVASGDVDGVFVLY